MTFTLTKTKNLTTVAITILALLFTNLTTPPSQAADPSTFTIEESPGVALTVISGTQGVAINKSYDITFSETGWNFTAQPNGNGSDFYIPTGQGWLTANVSFLSSTHATMTVTGTPANGIYFNSYLELWDGLGNGYAFPFQVAIAATTTTPHITVDAANHTYGDVILPSTSGLFTSMPRLYLDTENSGILVELVPWGPLALTTVIDNNVTTISYDTGALFTSNIMGEITARVEITITDGAVSYSVQTVGPVGDVAAGNIVFKSDLASGTSTFSATSGTALATIGRGKPFSVFRAVNGDTPTTDANGQVTMTAESNTAIAPFGFRFYDYTGCAYLAEMIFAYEDSPLPVTGYESAAPCASFNNNTLAENGQVTWAVSGSVAGYSLCSFLDQTIDFCFPASSIPSFFPTRTFNWVDLSPTTHGHRATFRLYPSSNRTTSNTTWSSLYANGDYFDVASRTVVNLPVSNPPVSTPTVVAPIVVPPVANGVHTPNSRNSSTLGWAANKDAKTIEVRVNDKVIATLDGTAITHGTSALIGPKDKVEAIAKDAAGNSSVLASFTYVAKGDIALGGVRFGADSAKLTPATKALLKKYAASIVEHGFTTAKVAAFTKFDASRTPAFRTKLAKARAAAITSYLNKQFKAAGVTVKIIAAGKGVKARSGEVFTQ